MAGVVEELTHKEKKPKATMQDKQQIYSELIGQARATGKKDGWAYYKYKEFFGNFPANTLEKKPLPPSETTINFLRHLAIKARAGKK